MDASIIVALLSYLSPRTQEHILGQVKRPFKFMCHTSLLASDNGYRAVSVCITSHAAQPPPCEWVKAGKGERELGRQGQWKGSQVKRTKETGKEARKRKERGQRERDRRRETGNLNRKKARKNNTSYGMLAA
eukprot:352821-Chlamydomonas_euryale.AAC.6